jgi:putative MATE family efflux protein
MAEQKKQKVVTTTLDSLDFGPDVINYETEGPMHKYPKPESVTSRHLYGDIITIALPSFLELVLTQLTSMADQIMVGNLPGNLGVQGLSAVGLSMNPKFILMTALMAMNTGTTAMVARLRGMGDQKRANRAFRMALLFNLVLSTIMMILGVLITRPLIRLVAGNGISPETYEFACEYLRIQMWGFVPLCLTNTITSSLRGIGDSKMPLFYNTTANVVNVIFNYLLIYGKLGFPYMKVAGASLATVIGQTVAFCIALGVLLSRSRYIYLDFKEKFEFDWEDLKSIVNIGIPSMIEQVFMRIGIIIFTRLVTSLGDVAYATHQVCMNIQSMSFMTGFAFATSSTTLMGQSLGKRRLDMADNYTRHTCTVGYITSTVIAILLAVFGGTVVSWYNKTPEIIALGGRLLLMVAIMQPFQSSQFIQAGALRGAGDTKFPAMVTFVTVLGLRSILGILCIKVLGWGLWGAWIAMVGDQLVRTILMQIRYRQGKWRFLKLSNSQS